MITPILRSKDAIATWLIDLAGNVAISISDLALLRQIQRLIIPAFVSTEQAMLWGSNLDPRATRNAAGHTSEREQCRAGRGRSSTQGQPCDAVANDARSS